MKPQKTDQYIQRYLKSAQQSIALSDAKAAEKRKQQGETLSNKIEAAQAKLDEEHHSKIRELRTKLDELRVQIALGKMESADALHKAQQQLKDDVKRTRDILHKTEDLTEAEVQILSDELHDAWRDFNLDLTMLYLRLETAHDLGQAKFDQVKETLRRDIEIIEHHSKEALKEINPDFYQWAHDIKAKLTQTGKIVLQSVVDGYNK